ncbi:hypothetical protein HMPREF1633_13075 [Tissierellia bacterium S5-A11]|nr:hypothetical protein HMPREF1633_13075 [Tissierellia bacterium S5-A11]
MLIIFTLAFCLISYVLKINAFLVYFSYICGLTIVKSFISDSLKDLFIISKSTKMYRKIGLAHSFISGSSLLILCLYYSIMEYGRFSYQYLIPMILVNFLIYRFIFWDMSYEIHRKILNRKIGSDF